MLSYCVLPGRIARENAHFSATGFQRGWRVSIRSLHSTIAESARGQRESLADRLETNRVVARRVGLDHHHVWNIVLLGTQLMILFLETDAHNGERIAANLSLERLEDQFRADVHSAVDFSVLRRGSESDFEHRGRDVRVTYRF